MKESTIINKIAKLSSGVLISYDPHDPDLPWTITIGKYTSVSDDFTHALGRTLMLYTGVIQYEDRLC